jgi:hypothetical protein
MRGPHPLGLPDPRQRGQAGGQRQGIDELAAQREAIGDLAQRGVEHAPLIGHLGHPHVRDAHGGSDRPAGRRVDLQHLPVGAERRVEPTLGTLDLAKVVATPCGQVVFAA